jgi:hypothetical protein
MTLECVTLLTEKEHRKYRSRIPLIEEPWWLREPASKRRTRPSIVSCYGVAIESLFISNGGIRPLCIFSPKSTGSSFLSTASAHFIGSKLKFGEYLWTIIDIKDGKVYALCDSVIGKCGFGKASCEWEKSDAKAWLETKGLKLIQREL